MHFLAIQIKKAHIATPLFIWTSTNLFLFYLFNGWHSFWGIDDSKCIPMIRIAGLFVLHVTFNSLLLYLVFPRNTSSKIHRSFTNFSLLGPFKYLMFLFSISLKYNTIPCIDTPYSKQTDLLRAPVVMFTLISICIAVIETLTLLYLLKVVAASTTLESREPFMVGEETTDEVSF